MNHWQTNIGGAVGTLGTALIGVGVLGNLTKGPHAALLWYIALAGFFLSALGKFLAALFSADAKTVNNVAAEVDRINQKGQSIFAQPAVENKPVEVPPQPKDTK